MPPVRWGTPGRVMICGSIRARAAHGGISPRYGTQNFDEVAEDRVFDEVRAAFAKLIGATAASVVASIAWAVMPPAGLPAPV